jgi:hypothetical protein
MKIRLTFTVLFFFLLQSACQITQKHIDREEDKKAVDDLVTNFFIYQKERNYESMYVLFTTGNSGLSRQDFNRKLFSIFKETETKNGDVVKQLSKSSHTEVTVSGKDSVGIYEAAVENERRANISRETFKMMLEKGELKIYDYQIAVKAK